MGNNKTKNKNKNRRGKAKASKAAALNENGANMYVDDLPLTCIAN